MQAPFLARLVAMLLVATLARSQAGPRDIESALRAVPLDDPRPLHADTRDAIVRDVYAVLAGRPAWFEGVHPLPAARAAAAALAGLAGRGLDPEDYDGIDWPARLSLAAAQPSGLSPSSVAELDVRLTRDVVHAASDLLLGRINPAVVGFDYALPPDDVDLAALVIAMAAEGDASHAFDSLEPTYRQFELLREALPRYRALAESIGPDAPIDLGSRRLRIGDRSPDLRKLAEVLVALGDVAPGDREIAAREPLGPEMETAIRRFQERHGLAADGVVGRETRRELGVPMSARVRQMELTLERGRWLPRRFTEPLVLVNIPSFRISAFDVRGSELERVLRMRAIVGREFDGRRTPLVASRLRAIVFSPYWEVPARIAREELLPQLLLDPVGMGARGYVIEGAAGPMPIDAESAALVRAGRARIRQRPGPDNVLDGMKLVFPNRSSAYVHGTSAPSLFEEPRRALSHGCIRVEDPVALASHVLRDDPPWTAERIAAAMSSGKQLEVPLSGRDWIVIVYGTASVDDDGNVHFFRDVYAQDARLARALAGSSP